MKQCMSFAKGMGMGIVAGIAVAASVKCMCQKNSKFRRKGGKAVKAISGMMSDLQELLD